MRANTFSHLEALASSKRIVCERTGKRITLTTPDGGTTAECDSVAEALDTLRSDSTFADLPIVLAKPMTQATPEETALAAKGEAIAKALGLRRDPEHADRYKTAWGSKTALGLARTLISQLSA